MHCCKSYKRIRCSMFIIAIRNIKIMNENSKSLDLKQTY